MKHISEQDLATLRQKLIDELTILEGDLSEIAVLKDDNWTAVSDTEGYDNDDERQRSVEYIRRRTKVESLEGRFNNIKKALEGMKTGTYGICEVSGKDIEIERLMANPAARTNLENKDVDLTEVQH